MSELDTKSKDQTVYDSTYQQEDDRSRRDKEKDLQEEQHLYEQLYKERYALGSEQTIKRAVERNRQSRQVWLAM